MQIGELWNETSATLTAMHAAAQLHGQVMSVACLQGGPADPPAIRQLTVDLSTEGFRTSQNHRGKDREATGPRDCGRVFSV